MYLIPKGIKDLLMELRRDGDVVAVVVDEFGGAEGIVTIEDIMEEVVEEIHDEYDARERPRQWMRKVGEREYILSARVELDTLEEKLNIQIPEGNYVTLAGFLLHRAREVPATGTVIKVAGITYTIERGTPQAITEVRVNW